MNAPRPLRLALSTLALAACASRAAGPAPAATTAPAPAVSAPLVNLEQGPMADRIRHRIEEALKRPDVNQGFDRLIERVIADPGVSQGGERLMGDLAADAVIAQTFGAVLADISEHPAMSALVADLMARNPGMSPDQVGSAVGTHVEGAIAPVLESLVEGPEIKKVVDQLDGRLSRSPHLRNAFGAVVSDPARIARWKSRARELNGGVEPSDARAAELLLDQMFTVDRIARFYIDFTAHPAVTRRMVALSRSALEAPAFRGHAVNTVRSLVAQPSFRPQLLAFVGILLEPTPAARVADRTSRARVALERAGVGAAFAGFAQAVVDDPALAAIGDRQLGDLMADPGVTGLIEAMFDRW